MNQSPNSLRDMIRIENSDLGKIGVVEIDGNHYVTESSIVNFMNNYDIDSGWRYGVCLTPLATIHDGE